MYDIFYEGRMPEYDLMASHLEKFALEVASKKAADWLNKQLKNSKYVDKSYKYDELNGCWEFRTDISNLSPTFVESFTHLELIQEAVESGWKRTKGLKLW